MNNIDELWSYLNKRNNGQYTRDNYDKFIKNNKLVFNFPSIHITGTNGKGSTANYIQNILIKSGLKVALYHSPYFYSPCEMIKINNQEISSDEFLSLFNQYEAEFNKYDLSEFEIETIIGFIYFINNNVDIAIIEVGMGGEVDATNILSNNILSIITSISLEHTSYLGRTISEITMSKAGIIKENSKVLVGKIDSEASETLSRICSRLNTKIYSTADHGFEKHNGNKTYFSYLTMMDIELNTTAGYQIENAKLAIEAINLIKDKFPVDENTIREGLKCSTLPGRMEFVLDNVLLDGGHNVEAITHMLKSVERINNKPITCLFAAFRDKNIDGMLSLLSRDCQKVIITSFDHKRARTENEYFLYLFDYEFAKDWKVALDDLILNHKDELILVTGSLAFVSLVRKYIKEKY